MATQFETEVLRELGALNSKIDRVTVELHNDITALQKDVSQVSETLHDHVLKDEITQQFKTQTQQKTQSKITLEDVKGFAKVIAFVGAIVGGTFAGVSRCDDHPAPAIHKTEKVTVQATDAPDSDPPAPN